MDLFDAINLGLALLAVGMLLSGVLWLHRALHPSSEAIRKIIHIGVGMLVLPFPWLFHSPAAVIAFSLILTAMFVGLRCSEFLRRHARELMPSVRRDSWGEFYFMLVIPALFILAANRPLMFIVPMLLLTLADAAAALLGRRYGLHPLRLTSAHKSMEGCAAFFITAFVVCHVPMLLFSRELDRGQTLAVSFAIAALTTVVEAISFAGLDNLLIPLSAAGVLVLCEFNTPMRASLAALALAITLLLATLAWHRTTATNSPQPPLLSVRGVTWRF